MEQSIRNIINKGNSASANEGQKEEFKSLFHQPDLEFELKSQLLEDLTQTEGSGYNKPYFDGLFEKFWNRRTVGTSFTQPKNLFAIRFSQWAAILAIGLFLGYFVNSGRKAPSPVYYTCVSPKGSISEMYMPDGSHIFLNSGSEIKYSVDGKNGMREVFLTGEAWFQVAKMKEKPFLVHTSLYDVKVTGTSFNVKAYAGDNDAVTTLEEGSVHISSPENLKLAEDIVLKPGEQAVYNKRSKSLNVGEVNTKWYTSWKENKLVFINMSLKDLRILLERKFGVEIEIVDQSILAYHYDGTIKSETIMEVLDLLKQTLPIQYQIVGQKVIINKK